MAAIAARWSLKLGRPVTPAQVTLCMIDLKLARLCHDPSYRDGVIDVIGYAALLPEAIITWNRFLEREEAHLMWARAEGLAWKGICYRFGISRPTAHRRWDYALSVIAWRLSGRQVHHRRGRRFVVARAG